MATVTDLRAEVTALTQAVAKEKAETATALAQAKAATAKAEAEAATNKALAETLTAKVADLTAQLAAGTPVSAADLDGIVADMKALGLAVDDITPAVADAPVDAPQIPPLP